MQGDPRSAGESHRARETHRSWARPKWRVGVGLDVAVQEPPLLLAEGANRASAGPVLILIIGFIFILVISTEDLCEPLLHIFECAFGVVLGTVTRDVLHELWKSFGPILRQIKPVHGLGEAKVSVDPGNDNACIDRQQLDAHKGHANVDIDNQTLVQDCVDDVREAAWGWTL